VSVGGDKVSGCCIFRVKGVGFRGACSLLRGGVGGSSFHKAYNLEPGQTYSLQLHQQVSQ